MKLETQFLFWIIADHEITHSKMIPMTGMYNKVGQLIRYLF